MYRPCARYVYLQMKIYTHTRVCMCVYVCLTYVFVYVCMRACMCTPTHKHTQTHADPSARRRGAQHSDAALLRRSPVCLPVVALAAGVVCVRKRERQVWEGCIGALTGALIGLVYTHRKHMTRTQVIGGVIGLICIEGKRPSNRRKETY